MAISNYSVLPDPDAFRSTNLGEPVITVVDSVTGEAKCTVDRFYSFIWTERYMGYGDFELEGPIDELWSGLIQEGDFIFFSHGSYSYAFGGAYRTAMIVESKYTKTNAEKGKSVFCNGRSLESLLERRINFGCRYGTLRSFKDGYLINNPTQGGNANYGLALTDCSFKGSLVSSSDGYRPNWYDHHAPLRTYELVPEVVSGVSPYYFYEYLALACVACNCGSLARTNRQFEFLSVQGTPYDASKFPDEYDPFRFKSLVKGIERYKYKADGWYYAIDRSKTSMANDTDLKYPTDTLSGITADQLYEETRFDWQDFANYPQPISEEYFKQNYSQAFYDSLHVCRDPYSGVGNTVYDIVSHCLEKCDGLDGGWGMKLTADLQAGKPKDWFTDPGVAANQDADTSRSSNPHARGHVELGFELYKGRDLTITGPHASDGSAVLFSEENDNVRYIDYLHGEADFKNVIIRTTGLEYAVEQIWNLNLSIEQNQRYIYMYENMGDQGDEGVREQRQKRLEEKRSLLEQQKTERDNIQESLNKLGLSQEYFSTELRDRNGRIGSDVHYPTGILRRELVSTEQTKADTFIDSEQLTADNGHVIAEGDPKMFPNYAGALGPTDIPTQATGVSANLSVTMDYMGRAQQKMYAYYKQKVNTVENKQEDRWYYREFSPDWNKYTSQLTDSNVNAIKLKKNSKTRDIETEVDFNALQIAGREYFVGDRVSLASSVSSYGDVGQIWGNVVKTMRCDEIVYTIDGSGFTAVPTFKILEDPDDETEMEGA